MKTNFQKTQKMFLMLAMAAFFFSASAFASTEGKYATNKTVEKSREAVANASPDDWKTLAIHAEKCMKKKVNLKEAAEWLDRSLAITEDPYNLRLKGDYYKINNLPKEAMGYYIKSIRAGLAKDINYRDVSTQLKIQELHNSRK